MNAEHDGGAQNSSTVTVGVFPIKRTFEQAEL